MQANVDWRGGCNVKFKLQQGRLASFCCYKLTTGSSGVYLDEAGNAKAGFNRQTERHEVAQVAYRNSEDTTEYQNHPTPSPQQAAGDTAMC